MGPPDAAVLGHHLRRLDADAFARFVADLWTARGYDVSREAEALVARRGPDATVIATDSDGDEVTRAVDVVVTPDRCATGTAGAADGSLGTRRGVDRRTTPRVVDADALADVLWYAVDREAAVALCRRHLGAGPTELRAPLRRRLRERLGPGVPSATLAVALLVAVAAVAVLVPGVTDGPSSSPVEPGDRGVVGAAPGATTPLTPVATTGEPSGRPSAAPAPPGVSTRAAGGENAVTDLAALAAAHERAVDGRSYVLWVNHFRPRDGVPDAPRVRRDLDVAVAGDRHLFIESVQGVDTGERRAVLSVYRDGGAWYAAVGPLRNVSYERGTVGTDPVPGVAPETVAGTLVERWLRTPETTVTNRIGYGDGALYQVVGTADRRTVGSLRVSNYTVEALVADSGLVVSGRATYTVETDTGSYPATYEWTYTRLDVTEFGAPRWYTEQFAGNATAPS